MNPIKTTPKDFFFQIGSVAALYVSVISLINLLLSTINVLFPDPLEFGGGFYMYDPYTAGLRWSIAALVIAFPLYLILMRIINRDIEREPSKADLALRRWITYLTLFASAVTIAVDLVVLLNVFLAGEVSTRFILKVIAVLVVAGLVFSYYFADLRNGRRMTKRSATVWRAVAIVVVLASIIVGFAVLGSPAQARKIRFDNQKVNDLQGVQWQVVSFWQQKQKLPASLNELEDPIRDGVIPVDRQSGNPYEYLAVASTTFKLCAEFNLPTPERMITGRDISMTMPAPVGKGFENWKHAAGKQCFERTIDPDLYPTMRSVR
jgi:hypothetical protein